MTGNKEFILFKVIDGEVHGRLGFCGLCGGRLKFTEDEDYHVVCGGRFDEDTNMRIPCGFQGDRLSKSTPRYQPWYTSEPTDEEKEEMDKVAEAAREVGGEGGPENPIQTELLERASKMEWKLSNKAGIQEATAELTDLVTGKLDLPEAKKAKMAIGSIVVGNKDKSPKEIVELVIQKYGIKEEKEKKAVAKEAALEGMCGHPKNAPVLMAFQELAQLYFKGMVLQSFQFVFTLVTVSQILSLPSFQRGKSQCWSCLHKSCECNQGFDARNYCRKRHGIVQG